MKRWTVPVPLVVIIGLSMAAAAAWMLWEPGNAHGPADPAVTPGPTAPRAVEEDEAVRGSPSAQSSIAPAGGTASQWAAVPLPPLDTPFAASLDELERRSRDGDRRAACRLAAEAFDCHYLRDVDLERLAEQRTRDIAARDLQGRELDDAIRKTETMLAHFRERLRHCAGVPAAVLDRRMEYDLRAGLLGDLLAQERYVQADGLKAADVLADPQLAALYRRHAFEFVRRRLEQGDPWAARALQHALDSGAEPPLAGAVPKGFMQPGVAEALMHLISGGSQGGLSGIDPARWAEAESLYLRFYRQPAPAFTGDALRNRLVREDWRAACEDL